MDVSVVALADVSVVVLADVWEGGLEEEEGEWPLWGAVEVAGAGWEGAVAAWWGPAPSAGSSLSLSASPPPRYAG